MEKINFQADFLEQKKRSILDRYGPEVKLVPGLVEYLSRQKGEVVAIRAAQDCTAAAYILDQHETKGVGMIVMSSTVGFYRNSSVREEKFIYRNSVNPRENDQSNDFGHIDQLWVNASGAVEVRVSPKDARFAPRTIRFE